MTSSRILVCPGIPRKAKQPVYYRKRISAIKDIFLGENEDDDGIAQPDKDDKHAVSFGRGFHHFVDPQEWPLCVP